MKKDDMLYNHIVERIKHVRQTMTDDNNPFVMGYILALYDAKMFCDEATKPVGLSSIDSPPEVTAKPAFDARIEKELPSKSEAIKIPSFLERLEMQPSSPKSFDIKESVLAMTIDDLDLPMRATNALRNLGVKNVGHLIKKRQGDLMKTRGFGIGTMYQITEALGKLNLSLEA